MSDTETKTARVRAVRDFTDAGTERFFAKGAPFTLSEAEAANFAAAGLIVPDEEPAAEASDTAPGRSKRT